MRRVLALLPVAAVLACLGCSSTPQPIDDNEFTSRVGALPSFAQLPAETTVDLARSMCSSLQEQPSEELREDFVAYYAAISEDEHGNGDDSRRFVDIAIARYCPDMSLPS